MDRTTEKTKKIIRVKDVMTQDIAVVDGMMTVADALPVFREHQAFMLLVDKRDENDEFGLVTLSDVAKKVLGKNKSPNRVNVYEIMLKPIVSVIPNMDVHYCVRLFDRLGFRRAPVIGNDGTELLGVISYKDIVLRGMLPALEAQRGSASEPDNPED